MTDQHLPDSPTPSAANSAQNRSRGSVLKDLRDVGSIVSRHVARRLVVLTALVVVRGIVEMAGVASLYPVLALLVAPESFLQGPLGAALYGWLGATSAPDAILRAALVYAVVMAVGYAVSACITFQQFKTIYDLQVRTAERLFLSYLRRRYDFFLTRSSSELVKNINVCTSEFASGVVLHLLFMFSSAVVLAALFLFLMRLAPGPALGISALLAVIFLPITVLIRRPLGRWGATRDQTITEWFATVNQALSGIKETKVHALDDFFVYRFRRLAAVYARMNLRFQASSTVLPHNAVHVGILGLLSVGLTLLQRRGVDIRPFVPTVGLYYVAFSRMLPQASALFIFWTTVRYYWPSFLALRDELAAGSSDVALGLRDPATDGELAFHHSIEFVQVHYRYPGAESDVIRDLTFTIPRGSRVGFIGRSGAGKTTVIDLLLGLLLPTRGQILIDGEPLTEARGGRWHRQLGFVPQAIYLFEASVAENVALGLESAEIDHERVRQVLSVARLLQHVDQLPNGTDTLLGGRGARLSGGEAQRLGIARALYRDPAVLVLDEVTSGLDLATEREINDEIAALSRDVTVVVISHRVHSLRAFDSLFLLDSGALIAEGTYATVIDEAVRRYGPAFTPIQAQ